MDERRHSNPALDEVVWAIPIERQFPILASSRQAAPDSGFNQGYRKIVPG
jgi:hypothetical protein